MKIIFILATILLSFVSAEANDELKESRQDIAKELNSVVGDLKQYFKKSDDDLTIDKDIVNDQKILADILKERSAEPETNPTVLSHGVEDIANCNEQTEELRWVNGKWNCEPPLYKTGCNQSSDEYKYEKPVGSGNYVCEKSDAGSSINYKWAYRGNSKECYSNTYKRKIYRCFYINKLGQEIDVEESHCGKSSDVTSLNGNQCVSTWNISGWAGCSKACGGGVQTRGVDCEKNHFCPGVKPLASQACNTQLCTSSWSTTEWGSCKNNRICRECGSFKDREICCKDNYEQTRTVFCPDGFACTGAKPSTIQSCRPKEGWCGKACEG